MQRLAHLTIVVVALAFVALVPAVAWAQTAFTERAKIIGTGEVIHIYGLPALNDAGKVKYFDVTITLGQNAGGKPKTAAVSAVASPKVVVSEFVPGVYVPANDTATCTLTPAAFAGRTQFNLHCESNTTAHSFDTTWYTGPIAGHPLEPILTGADLHTLPANNEFAWGRVGFSSTTFFGCFNVAGVGPDLVGAQQVGDTLTLTNYGVGSTFDCQINLFKAQP